MEILSTFDEYLRKVGRYRLLRPNMPNQGRHWPNYRKALGGHFVGYTIVDVPSLPLNPYARWFNYIGSEDSSQERTQRVEVPGRSMGSVSYFDNHSQAVFPRASFYVVGKPSPAWNDPLVARSLEKLLLDFASPESIKVARSIPEKDFSIREENRHALAADIGNTTVDINLEAQTIAHHCPIWAKSSLEQKFCPHVVKLFLSISPERARTTLALLLSDFDSWKLSKLSNHENPTVSL